MCSRCNEHYHIKDGQVVDFVATFKHQNRPEDQYGPLFGATASDYDTSFHINPEHGRWVLKRLLELTPAVSGPLSGVVLEIGAGTGHLTAALLSSEFGPHRHVIVSDLSDEMLVVNHREYPPENDDVSYARCNVRHLPARDESVDLVVGFDVLHHVLDYEQALAEIARVLRPGGVCAVKEPHQDAYRWTAFLCRTLLAIDRHWNPFRGLTRADRTRLWSWRCHILAMLDAAEAGDLEVLSRWDDKYMFAPDVLEAAAARAGFARFEECNVLRRTRSSFTSHAEFYAPMYIDWLSSIGLSARGLAWAEPLFTDLDYCIGDAILATWPMNTVFLFWR